MKKGFSFLNACKKSFNKINGANTIVAFNKKMTKFFYLHPMVRYYVYCKTKKVFIFSSEQYFLETALNKNKIKIENKSILKLKANFALNFNLSNLICINFQLKK